MKWTPLKISLCVSLIAHSLVLGAVSFVARRQSIPAPFPRHPSGVITLQIITRPDEPFISAPAAVEPSPPVAPAEIPSLVSEPLQATPVLDQTTAASPPEPERGRHLKDFAAATFSESCSLIRDACFQIGVWPSSATATRQAE
jgi:hypothetical protein